jgi:hypothetical protein
MKIHVVYMGVLYNSIALEDREKEDTFLKSKFQPKVIEKSKSTK